MILKNSHRKSKVHILILEVKWPPETFIMRKIEGLIQQGYHVSVAYSATKRAKSPKTKGLTLIRIPRWDHPITLRIWQFLSAFFYVITSTPRGFEKFLSVWHKSNGKDLKIRFNVLLKSLVLLGLKPDIVHFEWNSAAIAHQYLLPLWGCANVISCRGSQIYIDPHLPDQEAYIRGLQASFAKADAVHCVSDAIKDEAAQYGLSTETTVVIHPAVDPQIFSQKLQEKSSSELFHIVSVGNLLWMKGLEYALIAIKTLIAKGVSVSYKIIGSGEAYQHLLYTIYDLGIENAVQLMGRLSPTQVQAELQKADAFLLSSLSEGLSNAALEAMSCGLPVVSTDCGGMVEAITDGVEGFLVPVRDPDAMATALYKLTIDPGLRIEMGKRGRNRVIENFNLADQINAFAALYQSVLKE
jgi:colanic acid/amylovoran biosynthesis glycosyltransferase